MKKIVFWLFLVLAVFYCGPIRASSSDNSHNANLIDTPTTEVIDYGTYNLNFRLYGGGGVLTRMSIGVFKRLNIGFSWDITKLIGQESIELVQPAVNLKIAAYEGGLVLPAVALGYDGQGYTWDKNISEYQDKAKGVFLVLGREILVENLVLNLGVNFNDFKNNKATGFSSINYTIEKTLGIIVEYDNIQEKSENARLNCGLALVLNDNLNFLLAARDINNDQTNRPTERTLILNYYGRF